MLLLDLNDPARRRAVGVEGSFELQVLTSCFQQLDSGVVLSGGIVVNALDFRVAAREGQLAEEFVRRPARVRLGV